MNKFNIQIEDESEVLSQIVVSQNSSSIELYDWQKRAIDYFLQNYKAIYEVTTGAGKTVCAIEIMKKILEIDPDINILIVVPKNIILEDTWYKELYNNGFSLRDIGVFYGLAKEYGKITITNMQNLDKIALDYFQMIVLDELHNYGTTRLLELISQPFKYKIGLSATVTRGDNSHWKIKEIFDYNVFKYTPQQALREGILNPFNFINIGVDMDEISHNKYIKLTQDLNIIFQQGGGFNKIMRSNTGLKYKMLSKLNERKELVSNYVRKFDIIKIICEKHIKDKIIVFNSFNQQTNKCYWYLLDVGIKACIVHSGIEKEKREQNMIDFKKDKYNVILTSKVLDEGYNLPKIDTAIIMAGDSTSRQTIQRMGRVLRKKNKTSNLYQIYCNETVEEDYGRERSKLFKDLCSNYKEYNYNGEVLI